MSKIKTTLEIIKNRLNWFNRDLHTQIDSHDLNIDVEHALKGVRINGNGRLKNLYHVYEGLKDIEDECHKAKEKAFEKQRSADWLITQIEKDLKVCPKCNGKGGWYETNVHSPYTPCNNCNEAGMVEKSDQ